YLVMRSFFRDVPRELFREAFRPHLINPDFSSGVEQACEETFLYLHSPAPLNQLIGIERLHQLLHEPEAREVLNRAYRFDYAHFAERLKTLNVTNLFAGQNSAVLVDQGDGWLPQNIVRQPINPDVPRFRLVFDLERFASP